MRFTYIDVSRYQGKIDWQKVKDAGIQGAFLKTVSTNSAFGGIYIDQYYEYNYAECKRLGIPVGVYYYTYAQTKATADAELAKFKEAVWGKSFELPLVVDVEDNLLKPLSKEALTDLVEYAVNTIESWGCYAMVYTYLNYQNTELDMGRLAKYDLWLARYRSTRPSSPTHGIWQFTSSGTVPGVTGNVDMDYAYKDYPQIISSKGLNNLTEKVPDPPSEEWEAVSGQLYEVTAKNCEYFIKPDVNNPLGYLPMGAVYKILSRSREQINGFDWVKIETSQGDFYAAVLADRCKIHTSASIKEEAEKFIPIWNELKTKFLETDSFLNEFFNTISNVKEDLQ